MRPLQIPGVEVSLSARLLLLHLLCALTAFAQTSWSSRTEKVIHRFLETLEDRQRKELAVSAIVFDNSSLPYPRPGTNAVILGTSFITLAERLSLAVARDGHRGGYLDEYVGLCAKAENGIAELPAWNEAGVDADRLENEHITAFQEIVVTVVGADLFHHILDHYKKAHKQKHFDATTSIKPLLSERDVRRVFRDAIHTAHQCGYSADGALKLAASCYRSTTKPVWSAWFFPPKQIDELTAKAVKK